MKIKLIDFGAPKDRRPFRSHGNDAGADVYMLTFSTRTVRSTHRNLRALSMQILI